MSIETQLPPGDDHRLISSILANQRQRQLLAIIHETSTPLTERDLVVQLAAREGVKSPEEATETERQQLRRSLHHQYLPKLEQAGLIERHAGGIIAAGQRSLEDLKSTLPQIENPDVPSLEVLGALLARPRRQQIVSIIADHRHPLALEDLETALATRERASWTPDGPDGPGGSEDEPGLQATLHHLDLPKLDEVGLVDYDRDAKTVARNSSLAAFCGRTDRGSTDDTDADS